MRTNLYQLRYTLFLFLNILFLFSHAQHIGCDGDRFFNTVFDNVTVTKDIIYGKNTTIGGNTIDLKMDIYEPEGDGLEKRPVIVFAHGGGFTGGNKEGMEFICENFARRGFVTASISYRLLDVPITDPTILMTEVVMAVSDMKAAVRYFREDAATVNLYKIDSEFIFAGGISAGAIMANGLGYVDSLDNIPPVLLDIINSQGGFDGNSSSNTQFSSSVQGVLNYAGSLSSADFIDSDDPPLYSFHNEFDDIVFCGVGLTGVGSCGMHLAAEAVGIKNQFYFYSESDGHVLWPYTVVRHETAEFLGEILCETSASPTAWEDAPSGYVNPGFGIWDIEVVNENVIWTVATPPRFDVATQYFARSVDGGQTWTTGTIPVSDPEYGTYSVSALDENRAWAIAYDYYGHNAGKVYKTTDGGLTWTEQSSAFTEPNEAPHGIHFFDENDGYAFAFVESDISGNDSHAVYITSDGGASWERLSSDVYPAQLNEEIVDANLDFMEVKGDHIWIVLNTGNIFHSADRGHTWEVNMIDPFHSIASVAFKDEMNGIAVSRYNTLFGFYVNKAYATSDGGGTWSEIPAPPAPTTGGIHFVEGSADVPGACGTYIIYYAYTTGAGPGTAYSTDEGQTWTFISEQPVYTVDFASPELGWASGVTHAPDDGLFKWTGASLTGNENCTTSTKEEITDNSNLLIYPNPTSDILNIELKNDWKRDLRIQLINTLGLAVYSQSVNLNDNFKIDISDLQSGVYKILISDRRQFSVQTLLKQ